MQTTLTLPAIVTKVAALDLSGPVRPVGQDAYRSSRESTINTLLRLRDMACEDIRTATHHKVGTQWMADRIRVIEQTNATLVEMGVYPAK